MCQSHQFLQPCFRTSSVFLPLFDQPRIELAVEILQHLLLQQSTTAAILTMSGSEHQPAMVSDGPATAQAALFVPSEDLSQSGTKIRGPDFNMPYELQGLLNSYATIGFQASGLTKAIEIVNRMVGRNLLLASGTQVRMASDSRHKLSTIIFTANAL